MSDEHERVTHVPDGAEEPKKIETPKELFGLPVSMFVKGGTTSSGHDRMVAELEQDAERRRNEADQEKKLSSVPIEHGGARLRTHKFSEHGDVGSGFILLRYMTPGGEIRYENGDELQCLADVHVLGPEELCLTLVCPSCKAGGPGRPPRPQGQSQIRIRQSNKSFDFDVTKAGELILFEGKPYRSAGVVRESERFSCPDCGWSARIIDNRVRPE